MKVNYIDQAKAEGASSNEGGSAHTCTPDTRGAAVQLTQM